jgi:hypothetical protein
VGNKPDAVDGSRSGFSLAEPFGQIGRDDSLRAFDVDTFRKKSRRKRTPAVLNCVGLLVKRISQPAAGLSFN